MTQVECVQNAAAVDLSDVWTLDHILYLALGLGTSSTPHLQWQDWQRWFVMKFYRLCIKNNWTMLFCSEWMFVNLANVFPKHKYQNHKYIRKTVTIGKGLTNKFADGTSLMGFGDYTPQAHALRSLLSFFPVFLYYYVWYVLYFVLWWRNKLKLLNLINVYKKKDLFSHNHFSSTLWHHWVEIVSEVWSCENMCKQHGINSKYKQNEEKKIYHKRSKCKHVYWEW